MINITVEATTPDGKRLALRHGIPAQDVAGLLPPRHPVDASNLSETSDYLRWMERRDAYAKTLGLSIANQIIQALAFPDDA
jgi:hypothetical protein